MKMCRLLHPRRLALFACAGMAALWAPVAASAEEVLKAVTAFPAPVEFSQSFLRFVDEVNERGKGIVKIQYLGGPEVIPPPQQTDAVRRGVVDMQYGPATYYMGDVPEVDAWVGSTVTAMTARANGGFAEMQRIYDKRLGAHLLGHFDTGITFHLYLRNEPKRRADGSLDLSGLKLRSQPIYREFFASLGVTNVSVPVPEVYAALERGVVDGVGWPLVGIQDLSWDKYLKYRIDPAFFQTDLVTIVNKARWAALSEDARRILEEVAVRYERESYEHYQTAARDTDAKVRAAGMTVITLDGNAAAAYRQTAFESAWGRLKAKAPDSYQALRAKYYPQ